MDASTNHEKLPEPERNDLLRRVDWRFLLRQPERPRLLDLSAGRISEALRSISDPAADAPGAADVVVLGFPKRRSLEAAHRSVSVGGEVACLWHIPVPGGAYMARRALRRAGFSDVRLYWPGPRRKPSPKFWLSLDSPDAAAHLLAQRPPGSPAQAALRPLWRLARRLGALAPVWALARAPGAAEHPLPAAGLGSVPESTPWLLLTGGERSINKVVGLPFGVDGDQPQKVFKFARIPEADVALEREAAVLRILETERPTLPGVPRVVAEGRRWGRRALGQTALHGLPLFSELTPETFPGLASMMTDWLIDLAGSDEAQAPELWWQRLVGEPLTDLERDFGAALGLGATRGARRVLEGLGALPQVCEHRDCSPWNVMLTGDGQPALLDWESAEPRGLPGLDLIYFLANAVFRMESAYGRGRARESYARLLDPATAIGSVAAECMGRYGSAVGISEDALARLRLLCWIVHCRSDYRHLEMEAAGRPSREALRDAMFLGLAEEELRLAQDSG
jgi:Phosphotransferase enzyme family